MSLADLPFPQFFSVLLNKSKTAPYILQHTLQGAMVRIFDKSYTVITIKSVLIKTCISVVVYNLRLYHNCVWA